MQSPEWLPGKTRQLIQRAVDALLEVLGDRVTSIVLVGSAMDATREDRARQPEIVVVVRSVELADIARAAKILRSHLREGARFRLLTAEEIDRSADFFTLEAAEWKARHVVLFGSDPFADLRWTQDDMRRSIVHQLRVLNRKVRSRVLNGLALDQQETRRAIAEGLHSLVIASRHALELMAQPAPTSESDTLSALARVCECDAAPLLSTLEQIHQGKRFEPLDGLGALHVVISAALATVGSSEVRVGGL